MRTILISMLWCSFALAGPLEDLDRTRVTALPEDEGAASAQLRAWSDAIARADTSLHNKAAREVVAVEKGLYAIAYKGYLGMVACKKSDAECDAALSAVAAECGYFDQAHLCREVRELSGLTPAALRAGVDALPDLSVGTYRPSLT